VLRDNQDRLLSARREQVLRGLALVLPRGATPKVLVFLGDKARVFLAVAATADREFCMRGVIRGNSAVFHADGPACVREALTTREATALAMCAGAGGREPHNPTVRWFFKEKENNGKVVTEIHARKREAVR